MLIATGTTGSIGKHLLGAVAVKSRLEDSLESIAKEFLKLKPTVIIHLGGVTSVKLIEENQDLSLRLNVGGALRMMESFAKTGGQKFIFASTGHVYGETTPGHSAQEDDKPSPKSIYAKHKLLAESELSERAQELGIKLVIARIFSVFGDDMANHYFATRVFKETRSSAGMAKYSKIENGGDIRDFIEPFEVAQRLELIAKTKRIDEQVQILNICTGVPTSVKQKVLGTNPNWPEDKISTNFSSLPHLVGSPELARRILGM